MNGRERVLVALRHEEPDRVPIDLGSMPSTGIMAIAYARLKRYLGLTRGTVRVYDVMQQLAEPEKEILELFHIDVIDLKRSLEPCGVSWGKWKKWTLPSGDECEVPEYFNPVPDGTGGWVIRDEAGRVIAKMPKGGYYFDSLYHPLKNVRNVREVREYNWSKHFISDEYVRFLERKAEILSKSTEYAILYHGAGSIHEWGQGLRGWKNWLIDLVSRKHIAEAMIEEMMEVLRYNLKRLVSALDGKIQIIGFGDDLGTQVGPQISLKTYREMLKPWHEELFQYVKKHSKLYVFLHSCGSIYQLMPDLIDAGVDILNPVQISARDMDPERLKKEFGEQLTFWGGGIDTQNVLNRASPEQVAEHVRRNISIFARGGGYVFNQVHNIQADVPPENVVAMFDAAYKYGRYPI